MSKGAAALWSEASTAADEGTNEDAAAHPGRSTSMQHADLADPGSACEQAAQLQIEQAAQTGPSLHGSPGQGADTPAGIACRKPPVR